MLKIVYLLMINCKFIAAKFSNNYVLPYWLLKLQCGY